MSKRQTVPQLIRECAELARQECTIDSTRIRHGETYIAFVRGGGLTAHGVTRRQAVESLLEKLKGRSATPKFSR